ncbi:hypothetical protein CKO28_19135 [Rhodovibrio sodomensis]|uniref:Glycosyltransferase subfamily 4-like N-terminal domain-containing protein n=1 Tax=Rhodovibrio sodomensis TaxID=1088 RepID=A0ABS1DIX1_9PROT|nr:glycosyltransferase [Rhodovibrio sodomensis]MBK1670154.1 hypothetical protein [Rhodovibrio sodomensis]
MLKTFFGRQPHREKPVHVCHLLLRLGYGGMENGVVNIVNHTDRRLFRHTIVCLEDDNPLADRLATDVKLHSLGGGSSGHCARYAKTFRVLREIRPDIVHTRNLPTIDLFPIAKAAGNPELVHSEHGLDMLERGGSPLKYRAIRRLGGLFTRRYVALSSDIATWMAEEQGIPSHKIQRILNGVDTARFVPADADNRDAVRRALCGESDGCLLIGSLGRLEVIKDHENLAYAYVDMVRRCPRLQDETRLCLGGDGSRREAIDNIMREAGLAENLVMTGYISDPLTFYQALDVFVLPSKSEGTSNTVLEAMSCGLAVVATDVGENRHLIDDGSTGRIVPSETPQRLADALSHYVQHPDVIEQHAWNARQKACRAFSLDTMIASYSALYRSLFSEM